jgi:protein TonB
MKFSVKVLAICLFISIAALAPSQTAPESAVARSKPSISDFGLAYPLSNDWIRATEMFRGKLETGKPQNFDVLLAAVYVPRQNVSMNSPSFSLRAYRQPATACKQSLEAMIAHSEQTKVKPEGGGITQFSAAGRDYFRVNLAHAPLGRHECIICTTAGGHLLVWSAGALTDKGLDLIVSTLNFITPLPPRRSAEASQSVAANPDPPEASASDPAVTQPEKVKVPTSLASGRLAKKVPPFYPEEARLAGIQGTVVMHAEINETGDVTDLELLDGPIALAGSAIYAVRQWKYKPYLLDGRPVAVSTEIVVNYSLWR